MKAALYLRISQDSTGQSLGVTRQQEDCAALAAQLGWDVVEVYTDNDVSATSGKARPRYAAMLAAMDAGEVEAVVAWHPDRLYRKVRDLGELIDVCKRTNVQIATVKAGTIDLTTPTGRLVAGLLAQVATYEGEAKSDRWMRSVRQRREAGDFAASGPRLYGYTRDAEVIPEEAEIIRWMFDEVANGSSIHGLGRQLEARGILTSMGNHWQPQSIKRLLTNPRLAGHATMSHMEQVGKRLDKDGREVPVRRRVTQVVGTGSWPAIIDEDTFQTVRALITARSRKRTPPPRVSVLLGLMYCGGCGAKMTTGGRMRKRGAREHGTIRVYRCTRDPGQGGCGKMSIQAETVEEIVEGYARARLDDPLVRRHLQQIQAAPSHHGAEIASLDARLVELEAELDQPGIPVATILRAIDRTKERLEGLLGQIVTTPPRSIPAAGAPWPTDLGRRHALIELVVEQVTILPATVKGSFDPRRVQITEK